METLLDTLYIIGLAAIWYGNFAQIVKTIKVGNANGISLQWAILLVVSIGIRSLRAILSDYWVWGFTYIVSLVIAVVFLGVVVYYKRKYPKK